LFCVFVFSYFIYYYAWTQQRHFTEPVGPILYYIVPAVLGSLFFASLRLQPAYKVKLSLFCSSLVASVLAAEFLLLSTAAPNWRAQIRGKEEKALLKAAKEFGVQFDTRTLLEFINDLHKKGIDALPVAFPLELLKEQGEGRVQSAIRIDGAEVLPLGGIANKVTVLCNETGKYIVYDSDEYGFRNPIEIWKFSYVDIAAVGDSYTQGFCVPSDKNVVALIRNYRPLTLNLGMGGNGPLLELASLREYLPTLKPKIVLWFYFEGNDLMDLKKEALSSLLLPYLGTDFSQGLLARQRGIDQALEEYIKKEMARTTLSEPETPTNNGGIPKHLYMLSQVVKLSNLRQKLALVHGMGEADRANLDLFYRVLRRAKTSVSAWGGRLFFVYLPMWERYSRLGTTDESRNAILARVKSLDIPIIDLHPIFQAHTDPLSLFPFRLGLGHYNEEGYRVEAEAVVRAILQ